MDNLQQKVNEQGILSYYQKTLKSKICREIRFEEILDEKQMNLYKQYQKPSCCIKCNNIYRNFFDFIHISMDFKFL